MIHVLLVHESPLDRAGGAELSFQHHLQRAPFWVKVETIRPHQSCDLDRFDAVIVGNMRPQGGDGAEAELIWTLRWATLMQGFRGSSLKSERDVHPCTHRDGRCVTGPPWKKQPCGCTHSMRDATELLYNACSAVQFLSPAHQKVINQLVRITTRQFVVASPIDTDMFRPVRPWPKRLPKALILGDAIRVDASVERRARAHGFEPQRIDYLSVPYQDMPELYNQYQAVVVAPIMFHAFGRIAVEAMACGCRVLANERVGALSWSDPLQASRQANRQFWARVMNHRTIARRIRRECIRPFRRRKAA